MSSDKKTVEKPPAGMEPVMMSMKMMESYGLKTGPGLKDTLAFKLFEKEFCLKEIVELGFYSAFHAFRKQLEVQSAICVQAWVAARLTRGCSRVCAEIFTEPSPCYC
jgi:hypothetical protein